MEAFNGQAELKQETINRLRDHIDSGKLVHGVEYKDGEGGPVGCIVGSFTHSLFEKRLGIPAPLAHALEVIYDGLRGDKDQPFALDFLESIEPGADLSMVWPRFLLRVLTDEQNGLLAYAPDDTERAAKRVVALLQRQVNGDEPTDMEWRQEQQPRTSHHIDLAVSGAAHRASYTLAHFAMARLTKDPNKEAHKPYEWFAEILIEELKAASVAQAA